MFFPGCLQHFEFLLERSGDSGLSRRKIHRGLVPPASARQVRRTLEELQKKGCENHETRPCGTLEHSGHHIAYGGHTNIKGTIEASWRCDRGAMRAQWERDRGAITAQWGRDKGRNRSAIGGDKAVITGKWGAQ